MSIQIAHTTRIQTALPALLLAACAACVTLLGRRYAGLALAHPPSTAQEATVQFVQNVG